MAIREVILANGQVDKDAHWGEPQRKRVIADWVAAEVVRILQENMTSGTGVGAYFGRTSAGKTGTTDNYADAWFCGFLPSLEATVWIGYPQGEIPMRSVHGIAVSGPTFPATIWKLFMSRAADYAPSPTAFRWRRRRPSGTRASSSTPCPAATTPPRVTRGNYQPQQSTTPNTPSDGFVQVPKP